MHFALNQQLSALDPALVAALIAVPVGLLTVVVQWFGIRRVSMDTNRQLMAQRGQLDRTLAEQSAQLDKTLAEQRDRTLNERFATAADRLGSDKPAAVRLAAVYAMAGLADDWSDNRQTCVDVLCAYLRLPYSPAHPTWADQSGELEFRANREVRHTAIRVIAAHLRPGAPVSWQGLNLDFTGVVFDGGDFADAEFAGGHVSFAETVFTGSVRFYRAGFSSAEVSFYGAVFVGGAVDFVEAQFSGGRVIFCGAKFSGGEVGFARAEFSGAEVSFYNAVFSGGTVDFDDAKFSGSAVDFHRAEFSGSVVSFDGAKFSGGTVDLSQPSSWLHPPVFPQVGPLPGLLLPPASPSDRDVVTAEPPERETAESS